VEQAHPELWQSKSNGAPVGTDVAEEHGSNPNTRLSPYQEVVGKGMNKHFSYYLGRKILESEGFRNSGF